MKHSHILAWPQTCLYRFQTNYEIYLFVEETKSNGVTIREWWGGSLYGDGTVVGKYGHNQPNRKPLKRQKIEHNIVLFTFNRRLGWVARKCYGLVSYKNMRTSIL